ncbi:MAG TPA: DNA repair protein RadA [Stellaceae bacterium]|jgi:DNA repair protein RadA/Sms|nr:DNA repair protein RadA [Stellaceae bacterium]
MAKTQARFACQQCGAVAPKWAGRCEACGAWNSMVEEVPREAPPKSLGSGGARRSGKGLDFVALRGDSAGPPRRMTGITELDRVCGGGLVPGSTILVGGDPGIGKSTLLLQAAAALAANGGGAAYITGEEAIDQVRLRAERLGVADSPVQLAAASSVRDIIASLDDSRAPDLVVIDSIQTMYLDTLDSAPGTVSQVRGAAQEMIALAKRRGIAVVLVGHVTKEGLIAGPRVLEHMVDTVLYFEGERGHQFRILRAVKNRFGATDEIGVFEMSDRGLVEVPNPSALFLADRTNADAENGEDGVGRTAGAAVFAGIEGTRPVLVEVQALVAPSMLGTPRRAVVGWDATRLAMITAVLDARCGLSVGANDIYLNIAGGLRIVEPAADLAVAAALVSALTETPVPAETVVFGEIGLSGRVRPVAHADARLKEAAKLGFAEAWAPVRPGARAARTGDGLATVAIGHLSELVARLAPALRRRVPSPVNQRLATAG